MSARYVGPVRLEDGELDTFAQISHFGALKTSSVIPVVKANFPGTVLDTNLWTETSVSGGAVTVERGVGRLMTGTNSAGSVKLQSAKLGRFEAGQVTTYQSGVRAGVGVADNIRRWGLMDAAEENGLFFEWSGTTFRVVARADSTDTAVESTSFNGQNDWTPGASNNTFRIFYSAGRALFCRALAGNIVLLHAMVDGQYPLAEKLDLGLYYENTNSGNTTDVELRVRGASSSVFGDLRRFNTGGAQIVADFGSEVVAGGVEGYGNVTKFGRNSDIDTAAAEDVWEGGGTYSGFPTGAPETVEVFSGSANDTSAGTGARTVRITGLKTSSSAAYETEDLTLNGTTAVTSSSTWYRVNRMVVLTAGSGGQNAGILTCRHTTTAANVFVNVAVGYNQSTVAAYTVPAGIGGQLVGLTINMARASGAAGSATVSLRVRETGGVFRASRVYEISNSFSVMPPLKLPIVLPAGADIKVRVDSVSDNNTTVTAEMEILLIDSP